jgi:predicted peptidase
MRTLFLVLAFAPLAPAAEHTGFINRTMKGPDGVEAKYVIFVPHNRKPGEPTPTILFLHGAGETGVDGLRQSQVGLGKAIRAREKSFPFLVVFPQAQKRESRLLETWYPGKPEGDRALAMLEATMKEFNGDPKRLYLTGLSMGGFGTWKLAHAMPKKWAAIAPVCGGGDPAWAADIKALPCWCFHGDKDASVPVARSRQMIDALRAAGAKPNYDEYNGVGHNSWDRAYDTDALYDWFLSHRQK